ncbi:hypothetical protein DICPUDRAFT_52532 [Dictyostelium purpureum]|uniref:Uncharacterized protein n=1 Tax=Dictyostelium purpureum TaxID=5786 RepID=F0Z8S4_DICPU|nr:uncharacterized protein DICPUDRAFT_52532 [Dictyostelium purpureum]EGC39681.1 hypothetical protein DICPUDRAFT_52532 [Dictyostelium purpureum]|eukprot:XP_003283790.1 hypothetical protein DICPUDRAFT_52532 [Dictyostelium purpureum]
MHFSTTIRKKGFSQRLEAVKGLENRSREDKATLLAAVETQRNTRLIKDLIIHIVFFAVFLLIVILQLNPSTVNNINTSLKNSYLFSGDVPYMDIKFSDDFKQYLTTTFCETVLSMSLDNEDAMNKIIGNTIRIRTTRIKPGSCTDNGLNLTCYSNSYDGSTKDRSPYGPNGIYTYTSNTHGSFVFGHNQYVWDRSGYYVDISVKNVTMEIQQLIDNDFIDVQTRAVIISFSTLNLNFQSRTTVFTMLTEWPASGEVNPYYSVRTYRVNMYMDAVDRFRGFLETVFFLFLIYYVYFFINEARIDYQLNRLRNYLLSLKNSFDIINLTLFIASTALYIAFLGDNSREVSLTDETIKYPLYLENLGQTALVLYQISAINILLMAFKTFRFLIIHKRLYILWIAISQSKLQLITFTIMFCIIMLGFLFSGWLTFGPDNAAYNGFVTSLGTLLQFIIGNPPDYEAMSSTNRALGPIYYLLFTIFMFFILMNMFIAIISKSYEGISDSFDKKQRSKRYLMTKWEKSIKSFQFLFRKEIYDIYDISLMLIDQRPGLIETPGIEPLTFKG